MTRVKICGLRDLATARAALEAGADYLGFVLAPSRRQIAPDLVRDIVAELPSEARTVGVFVNEPAVVVNSVVAACGLKYAQLSGDEPPEVVAAIRVPVLKAVRVGGPNPPSPFSTGEGGAGKSPLPRGEGVGGEESDLDRYRPYVTAFVLDSAGGYGGTGMTCDWSLAAEVAARYPSFLAGGLNPDNVGAAIAAVRPLGVDVSSGVEAPGQPGQKDVGRIVAFIEAVRRADI